MYMNNNERWQARLDPKSGKPYWKNLETGIKTWKNPQIRTEIQEGTNSPSKPKKSKQLLTNNVSNNINSSSDDSADNNWQERFDPKKGRSYWKNIETGVKTWKNPHKESESRKIIGSKPKPRDSKPKPQDTLIMVDDSGKSSSSVESSALPHPQPSSSPTREGRSRSSFITPTTLTRQRSKSPSPLHSSLIRLVMSNSSCFSLSVLNCS